MKKTNNVSLRKGPFRESERWKLHERIRKQMFSELFATEGGRHWLIEHDGNIDVRFTLEAGVTSEKPATIPMRLKVEKAMPHTKDTKPLYQYDKIREQVILQELDKEELKTELNGDADKRALLYQALFDDSEGIRNGYFLMHPLPGISAAKYKALWEWIETETANRKRQLDLD